MRMICAVALVGLAACSAMNVSTEMALLESGVTDTTDVIEVGSSRFSRKRPGSQGSGTSRPARATG